jgi:lipopolysaccharide export system protein LptA
MVLMKRWTAAAVTALILSGMGAGGAAQARQSVSSAPIDVSADEQQTFNSTCTTIFIGNVEILQNRSRLRAQRVTIISAKRAGGETGCGAAQRMEAEGGVYLVSDQQNARGDRAVYTFSNNTAVLTGDVILVKGKDVARGDRLTVNTKTNDAKLESTASGQNPKRRVRAVFYQDDTQTSDAPAAAEQR